jgi:chemotaxis methyl-accepting protein methylase
VPEIKSITSYDPFYAPDALNNCAFERFDVVLCNYVLCTLPQEEESGVLKAVQSHLLPNGVAYISVRADVPRGGYGVSSKGTYQRRVEMPFLYELRKTNQYRIYLLTRGFKLI